jgi:hypothetical protein
MEKDLIIIEAEVNGQKGKFLFDNGFSLSAISPAFADSAGIIFDASARITDANNKSSFIRRTFIDTLNIDGQLFIDTGFYEIDTEAFWKCSTLDGIIGGSVINKANWLIDFDQNEIAISSTPFRLEGKRVNVGFAANNSTFADFSIRETTYRTKIDLGNTSEFDLNFEKARQSFRGDSTLIKKGMTSLSSTGLGNPETNYLLTRPQKIKNYETVLQEPASVKLTPDLKYDAFLGNGYLQKYNVAINSDEKHYILQTRDSSYISETDNKYGFTIYPVQDSWHIIVRYEGLAGYEQLSIMDEIELIDGQPVHRFEDICAYIAYLEQREQSGAAVTFKTVHSDTVFTLPYGSMPELIIK